MLDGFGVIGFLFILANVFLLFFWRINSSMVRDKNRRLVEWSESKLPKIRNETIVFKKMIFYPFIRKGCTIKFENRRVVSTRVWRVD